MNSCGETWRWEWNDPFGTMTWSWCDASRPWAGGRKLEAHRLWETDGRYVPNCAEPVNLGWFKDRSEAKAHARRRVYGWWPMVFWRLGWRKGIEFVMS